MAFNGRFVVNLVHFAKKQGAESDDIFGLTGKTEAELFLEDCVVDDVSYNSVVEAVVELTKDPCFGLHAGENLNLAAAGLIMQLSQTCGTIKEAIKLSCQFANLGCDALPLSLVEKEKHYEIVITPKTPWAEKSFAALKHTTTGLIGFTIRQFHSLTQMKYYPMRIHFPWENDGKLAEYERVYGCPVHFNKKEISIFLTKKLVEEKILTSNYKLQRILLEYAEEKSAALKEEKGFVAVVKESVVLLKQTEFPSADRVASHLNMSTRSLQRKLQAEDYNYKKMIEELKKEFAVSYLKRKQLSVSEVAYLLGYADVSSFTRAFKKWFDQTPSEYKDLV